MRRHQTTEYESAQSPDLRIGIREIKQLPRVTFYDEHGIFREEKRNLYEQRKAQISVRIGAAAKPAHIPFY